MKHTIAMISRRRGGLVVPVLVLAVVFGVDVVDVLPVVAGFFLLLVCAITTPLSDLSSQFVGTEALLPLYLSVYYLNSDQKIVIIPRPQQ